MVACDRPGLFTAYAAVGAALWDWHRVHCGAGGPVPLLMIHGTADPSFPWTGTAVRLVTGATVIQLPVDDHREWWAGRNGCSGWSDRPVPDRADDGTTVVERRGQGCRAPTLFYRVEGGGHTWPGMRVDFGPSLGPLSRDLDATATIAEFFVGG